MSYVPYIQLIQEARFNITCDELEHFLSFDVKPLFHHSQEEQTTANVDESRVLQALNDVLQWAVVREPYQVSMSKTVSLHYFMISTDMVQHV